MVSMEFLAHVNLNTEITYSVAIGDGGIAAFRDILDGVEYPAM